MITEEGKVKETNSFKFLACLDLQKLKLKVKIKIHIKMVSLKNLNAPPSSSYYFINLIRYLLESNINTHAHNVNVCNKNSRQLLNFLSCQFS